MSRGDATRVGNFRLALDDARVDDLAGSGDGLEVHAGAGDLHQHEALILIEVGGGLLRRAHVAPPQLPPCARDEIDNAALRLQTFVDVIVTLEHDVDAMLDEDRFQEDAQVDRRSVPVGIRVERVMEVADLPLLTRLGQRRRQPRDLLLVHEVGVQRKEPDVAAHVGVVALAVHVEVLVRQLPAIVVVADRCLESDAGREQRRVRLLELGDEVGLALAAVHVVAEHDHQIERELRVRVGHLLADFVLRALAGAVVSDGGELQRAGPVGKRRPLCDHRRRRARQDDEGESTDGPGARRTPVSHQR